MYVWMHACMHGWMDGWMDVCMYVCVCICICIYIYMYKSQKSHVELREGISRPTLALIDRLPTIPTTAAQESDGPTPPPFARGAAHKITGYTVRVPVVISADTRRHSAGVCTPSLVEPSTWPKEGPRETSQSRKQRSEAPADIFRKS